MIEQLIKKYSDFYEGKAYTYIADKILENENIALSHRTLRRKIGEYLNSNKEECCGDTPKCSNCPNEVITTSEWDYPFKKGYFTTTIDVTPDKFIRPYKWDIDSVEVKNTVYDSVWNKKDTVDYFKNQSEYPLTPKECFKTLQPYVGGNPDNVLIVGDPHAPFTKKGYMEHCLGIQKRFDCGQVVFIGDILDSHYSSFHDSDPDGYGAGEELDRAINEIKEWHRLFPNAKVTLGNHDLIAMRKAFSAGLSSKWIKGLGEVLQTPTWEYDMSFVIHDVFYTHTLGGRLINAAVNRRQSTVAGHLHTECSITWNVSNKDRIFAMQVGCGIDDTSYAFSYAKLNAKKSIVSCGVVLDKGTLPITTPMSL